MALPVQHTMLRVASVFLCIVGARVLAQSIEHGVTSATELARDTTARRGLKNSQGCQSSVDNTNTEVTFGGRQFKVLPAASVSGYASSNDYNWHDVPEGWDVVTTTDDDWSDILSCVIASYRWSTHVLFVWDTSRDSYEAWGGADFTNGQWCCQWCYYDCSWAHADAYDEEGLPRRVRVSSYYGRVLIVSRPSAAPTREPTSYPTQFKFQSGWCSSDLDEYVGDASSVQDCWDKCESRFGSSLVAVDLDLEGQCYCQDDCQCLDLGHGMGYYVATRDNVIAELPGMCGGCSDVCTEKMYKGSCTGFKREAKGKWGDWTLPEYEGIACSKDQCCAANEDECCELNVGMIAGVAVAIFVVVAGCIGVCCFLGCKKRKQETGKPPSLPLVGDAREPPPPALAAMPPPTPPPALVPIPEHKKQRRFPEPSAPPPPSLAPIKAQAAGMLTEETPPQPSVPVAEPVQSTSSVGWGARSLQRLASWRAPAPETSEMEPEPEVPAAEPVPSSEGWGARGLQRLASWRAPAAAPPPITLGGKKVDVAQEELCSPRRVDMVHASVAKWYNSTGKGAALRTRFGPFPATPEALNKWYARNKVMTAFLDDQGVPPEF